MKQHIFAVLSLLAVSATSASALVPGDGGCTGPFIPLGSGILEAEGRPYPWPELIIDFRPGPYPGPTCPGPMAMQLPECDMLPNCPERPLL